MHHRNPANHRLSAPAGPALKPFMPLLVTLLLACSIVQADSSREQKQAKLDAACEAAREKALKPLRKQFVEECVRNQEQGSREECETYYADYGAQSGGRAPLFYDLPECEKAFEYQQSERRD